MPVTAAGWRIEPPVSVPMRERGLSRRHRRTRPTRRAAGDPVEVPRVAGDAVRGVLGRRAHRELVHVRLAEDDHAPALQPLDHRGVVRRTPPLEDLRPAGRGRTPHREDVLQRQRHSGERTQRLAVGARAVDRICLGERELAVDVQEGVDGLVGALDAVEVRLATSRADTSPPAIDRGDLGGARGSVRSLTAPPRPGCGAPGTGRPRRPVRRPARPRGSGRERRRPVGRR